MYSPTQHLYRSQTATCFKLQYAKLNITMTCPERTLYTYVLSIVIIYISNNREWVNLNSALSLFIDQLNGYFELSEQHSSMFSVVFFSISFSFSVAALFFWPNCSILMLTRTILCYVQTFYTYVQFYIRIPYNVAKLPYLSIGYGKRC